MLAAANQSRQAEFLAEMNLLREQERRAMIAEAARREGIEEALAAIEATSPDRH